MAYLTTRSNRYKSWTIERNGSFAGCCDSFTLCDTASVSVDLRLRTNRQ
ncbi:hypothetical protein [Microcoleus sp.]